MDIGKILRQLCQRKGVQIIERSYAKTQHAPSSAEAGWDGTDRYHDQRHTFATLAIQNGVDIKTVFQMLGHYSAGFTLDTYAHVTTAMQKDVAAKVVSFLQIKSEKFRKKESGCCQNGIRSVVSFPLMGQNMSRTKMAILISEHFDCL